MKILYKAIHTAHTFTLNAQAKKKKNYYKMRNLFDSGVDAANERIIPTKNTPHTRSNTYYTLAARLTGWKERRRRKKTKTVF